MIRLGVTPPGSRFAQVWDAPAAPHPICLIVRPASLREADDWGQFQRTNPAVEPLTANGALSRSSSAS